MPMGHDARHLQRIPEEIITPPRAQKASCDSQNRDFHDFPNLPPSHSSYFAFEPPFFPIFSSQLECIHSSLRGSVPRNFKDLSLDNQGDHLGEYRERERAIGRAITGGRGCGSPIAPRGEAAPNEAEAVYAVQPLGTPALRHAPREPPRARVRKSGGARRGEERERERERGRGQYRRARA